MRRKADVNDRPLPGDEFNGPFILEDWLTPGRTPGSAYVNYLGAVRRYRERHPEEA